MSSNYADHPVHDRLCFADRRLNDLRKLNKGDIAGALHRERQPLVQEFFFHLCGAIDFLAQEVNNLLNLGLGPEDVTVPMVCKELEKNGQNDTIGRVLSELHPRTRGQPLPADPYSEDGSHFRIILFRNFVSHIRHSPFLFCCGGPHDRSAHLFLDPRRPPDQRTPSRHEAFEELRLFLDLIRSKCDLVLKELGISVS